MKLDIQFFRNRFELRFPYQNIFDEQIEMKGIGCPSGKKSIGKEVYLCHLDNELGG